MKRLILTACLLAMTATAAHAGPIRDRLAARFARPTCGSCQPASAPQYTPAAPPVTMPQVGEVRLVRATSYDGLGVPVDGAGYTPTRLGSPVPVCGGGVCR